jgi:Tfp pilus assembly protein PilO
MTKMRQWTVFTVVAVLVVLVAGWLLLVKPEKSKVSDLKAQASAQQQANQLLLTQISALQAEQKQLPQQQLTLAKFNTEVPDNMAEPTLIRQLSTAANGAGVDMTTLTPAAPTAVTSPLAASSATAGSTPATSAPAPAASGTTSTPTTAAGSVGPAAPTLEALPVAIGVTGSYANMVSFFQALERLPRAMLVSGWSMCPINAQGASSAAGGASCSTPTVPSNKTPPTGTLGATINATVFFSPPAAPTTTTGSTTLGSATTSTTTGTTTSPATTPTAAAAASAS